MIKDFNELTQKEKYIWVWVKFIDFEFREYAKYKIEHVKKAYIQLVNEILNPILINHLFNDDDKVAELCEKGAFYIKEINGNHFHIYLFKELSRMIQERKIGLVLDLENG